MHEVDEISDKWDLLELWLKNFLSYNILTFGIQKSEKFKKNWGQLINDEKRNRYGSRISGLSRERFMMGNCNFYRM